MPGLTHMESHRVPVPLPGYRADSGRTGAAGSAGDGPAPAGRCEIWRVRYPCREGPERTRDWWRRTRDRNAYEIEIRWWPGSVSRCATVTAKVPAIGFFLSI
ncbi:hypothetical protein KRMM14A1004_58100 [Krasilnikovia sp. MM14-A1004]